MIDASVTDLDLQHLEAFDDLLPVLAEGLDIREVFGHISEIATRIVPHDEANLILISSDGSRKQLYATTSAHKTPGELPTCDESRGMVPKMPAILETVPGPPRGLYAGVTAPLVIGDKFVGVFALFSKTANAYRTSDLGPVQRLANYLAVGLAHQQLADSAKDAAVERARTANVENSVELLRTISNVLDIRTVFPRVSEIANQILPHDFMSMMFQGSDGGFSTEATSSDDFPQLPRSFYPPERKFPDGGYVLHDDIETVEWHGEPADMLERTAAAGLRSVLVVQARAQHQWLNLVFWSKRTSAFSEKDVPVARRIADHVALAVSHEQLSAAAQQVAEAHANSERLETRVQSLVKELESKTGHGRVIGHSPEWVEILKQATQVAGTDTTVLLTGESGTGKEVVARFVHRASARKTGPFVALNCAALPDQLLESELFGYERGAFTGAQQSKRGQIEVASGGVLFLDEVGELSMSAQAKFLRVLQEREFQRLGATQVQRANVRIVAATNRDLRKAVERGDFREDLFYRLQVFDIRLPPLRERRSDIMALSEAFLEEIAQSFGRPPAGLTRDAKDALIQYDWPGNVRELRNMLERAAILCEGGLIDRRHLSIRAQAPQPAPAIQTTDIGSIERDTIERVLRETRGNKSLAARQLGLSRTQLYVRLRKYNLDSSEDALSIES